MKEGIVSHIPDHDLVSFFVQSAKIFLYDAPF